jgi:hypothetical protein
MPLPRFNRSEEAKDREDILIPEGEQLFFLYNMFFNRLNTSPKGKKYPTDFTWGYIMQFSHAETEALMTRLDNGQEGRWASSQKLYQVGNIDNIPVFLQMMKAIGAPYHPDDPKKPDGMGAYWIIKDDRATFPPYDAKPAGPLGLPIMLEVIHKDVPVLAIRPGAVKDQRGNYDDSDYIQKCDSETGKPLTQTREFISCLNPKDHNKWDVNEFKAIIESGFPKILPLPEEHTEKRGPYFVPEDKPNRGLTSEEEQQRRENKEVEDKMNW